MSELITKEEQKRILKQYLGIFYVKPDKELYGFLKSEKVELKDAMLYGTPSQLKTVALYYLLTFGRQNYTHMFTYDLVERFLGNDEEEGSFQEEAPFLILYHMRNTMPNKQLENMVNHLISRREIQGKVTVMLAESAVKEVEDLFAFREKRVIRLAKAARGDDDII